MLVAVDASGLGISVNAVEGLWVQGSGFRNFASRVIHQAKTDVYTALGCTVADPGPRFGNPPLLPLW